MKPLVLSMQAFGPFAGRQEIDFSALGEQAFFLIHGPTGAGKTTLLDALCFALYGDTSGGERRGQDMRSDHAERSVPTSVELVFQLGAQRYRVKRSPTQARPKQRGEGVVVEQAKAELHHWQAADWKTLETQTGRVDERIRSLLGFDSAQFRQVIVLPQGRFRELLTADSKTRQQILERLFRTEIYRRVEEALKAEVATIKAQAEKLAIEKRAILTLHSLEAEAQLDLAVDSVGTDLKELREGEQLARLAAEVATRALQQGESAAFILKELDVACAEHAALRRQEAEMAGLKERLGSARRAQTVQPAELALRQSREEWERAQAAFPEFEQQVQRAEETLSQAVSALQIATAKQPEQMELHRQLLSLEQLATRVEYLAKAREAEREAACRSETVQAAELAARNVLQAFEIKSVALQKEYDDTLKRAGQLDVLRLQIKAFAVRQEKLQALTLAEQALGLVREQEARARAAEQQAADAVAAARDSLALTEQSWLRSQSARLALQLKEGQPCPVCGSAAHPLPADSDDTLVSDAALQAARDSLAAADGVWHAARQQAQSTAVPVLQAEERIRGLRAELSGDEDIGVSHDALVSELDLLHREEALAAKSSARCAELAILRTKLSEETAKARAAYESAQTSARTALGEHARSMGALTSALETVPDQWRDSLVLSRAIGHARQALATLEKALAEAQIGEREAASNLSASKARRDSEGAALAHLAARHEAAFSRFAGVLREVGFRDADEYRVACMSVTEQEGCEQSLSAFAAAFASARDRLSRAVQASEGLTAPDLSSLQEATRFATARHEAMIRQVQDATGRREALLQSRTKLQALNETGRAIEERYSTLGRLSEIANGNNPRRMTFQRFVLATLLDEVLEAASLRLLRMSRSRYELRRVMQQGDLRQAGGLDLEVFDHETGASRPANTLSGGEGFLASLSLALGLADVVQSRAGGIQMETLFVDEGFGTLDPESLDFAIRTLIDLQQTGRLVGIISHVAELRERIDVRLEIKPSKRGSIVDVRVP